MTQNGNGKVSLNLSNWFGIVLTVVSCMGGQWMLLHGRVTTLEANQKNITTRIDAMDVRAGNDRREILDELRSLRHELKAK